MLKSKFDVHGQFVLKRFHFELIPMVMIRRKKMKEIYYRSSPCNTDSWFTCICLELCPSHEWIPGSVYYPSVVCPFPIPPTQPRTCIHTCAAWKEVTALWPCCCHLCRLECQIQSQPPPLVTWYVNGMEIKPSPHYEIRYEEGKSTLLIIEVGPQDTGEYTCRAVSELGEAISSTTLYVQGWSPFWLQL